VCLRCRSARPDSLSSVGRRRYGALSVTARGEGAVESQVSGQAYRSELRLEFDQPAAAPRAELADVGKLVRRGVRAVVGAARAEDRVTLTSLLLAHLGATGAWLAEACSVARALQPAMVVIVDWSSWTST
jgi:hypothetical protein